MKNSYTPENACILLTATIRPGGMAFTALQDPEIRLQQYLTALDHYLQHTDYPIIFCENSMAPFPLEQYAAYCAAGRLEILQFAGNDFPAERGKGYGESLIIEYAVHHSRLLREREECCIIKITGRLIIRNLETLCCHGSLLTHGAPGIAADMHRLSKCGSQCVIAPVKFWRDIFCPAKDELDDSCHQYFEHLLARCIRRVFTHETVRLFLASPQVLGVSGTDGRIYTGKRSGTGRILHSLWLYAVMFFHHE